MKNTIDQYKIKGFVLSNISNFRFLKSFNSKDFNFVANYTFNIFNKYTIKELLDLGINTFTISPELNKECINELTNNANHEIICYGRAPLMNMNYCPLGKSNRCYPGCDMKCKTSNKYYLKDRMNFMFPIIPDNIQTVSTLYNSKITSISPNEFDKEISLRIDILDESIEQIQNIIETIKNGTRLEGVNYTTANLNKEI